MHFLRMIDAVSYALRYSSENRFEVVQRIDKDPAEVQENASIYAGATNNMHAKAFFTGYANGKACTSVHSVVVIHDNGVREWVGDIFVNMENEREFFVGYAA